MLTGEYPYAGLILPDADFVETGPYLDAAEEVLLRLDCASQQRPRRSRKRAAVMGDRYGLLVVPQPDCAAGPRIAICAIARGGGVPRGEDVARILSDVVLDILQFSPAESVEWCSPDVHISAADFIRLRSYVSPRRKHLAPISHKDEQALAESIREAMEKVAADLPGGLALSPSERRKSRVEAPVAPQVVTMRTLDQLLDDEAEPQAAVVVADSPAEPPQPRPVRRGLLDRIRGLLAGSDPERRRMALTSWLMAGILATLSLPVAASLVVVGLVRGMDFRLATQALSLTALFVVLENTNMLSGAMTSILP
ncbi:hypothetical protein [Salipiger sp.]